MEPNKPMVPTAPDSPDRTALHTLRQTGKLGCLAGVEWIA